MADLPQSPVIPPRRPAGRSWARGLFFVLLAALSYWAHVLPFTVGISPEHQRDVGLAVAAASMLVAYGFARLLQPGFGRRVALCAGIFVVAGFSAMLPQSPGDRGAAALYARGEEVPVTVIGLRVGDEPRSSTGPHNYLVAWPDGRRIPGVWHHGGSGLPEGVYRTEDAFRRLQAMLREGESLLPLGSTVTLVVDPQGLVHPRTADLVGSVGYFVFTGLMFGLPALLLALAGGGPLGLLSQGRPGVAVPTERHAYAERVRGRIAGGHAERVRAARAASRRRR
jgi:hypothetical protein